MFREGLVLVLATQPDMNVVAQASNGELAESFRALGDELTTVQPGGSCPALHVSEQGSSREPAPVVHNEAYRIGCEALRNAFRHVQASRVEVAIQYGDRQFRLRISDNGKGIDPKIIEDGGRTGHHGLPGMRETEPVVRVS